MYFFHLPKEIVIHSSTKYFSAYTHIKTTDTSNKHYTKQVTIKKTTTLAVTARGTPFYTHRVAERSQHKYSLPSLYN